VIEENSTGEEEAPAEGKSGSSTRDTVLGLAFMALIGVGLYFFWNFIEPDKVREADNPTFLDSIFANAAVIGAARIVLLSLAIVLLFGSIYVAASSVVRIRRGQWLRRAGPFESHLDEAKEELDELDSLLDLYTESVDENAELAARLAERDQQLEQLAAAYGAAVALLEENDLLDEPER
jgi:hypothetical protein